MSYGTLMPDKLLAIAQHRARILAAFEKHRATPGVDFPEEGFLNHLMANPKGPRAVRNSFSGLRRFNAFIDEVQLEFGICFSVDDLEKSYSLPRFVTRVQELEESPRGSMTSLNNQIRAGPGWGVFVVGNLVLLALTVAIRDSRVWLAIVAVAAVLANVAFFEFYRRVRKYQRQLAMRIELRSDSLHAA